MNKDDSISFLLGFFFLRIIVLIAQQYRHVAVIVSILQL